MKKIVFIYILFILFGCNNDEKNKPTIYGGAASMRWTTFNEFLATIDGEWTAYLDEGEQTIKRLCFNNSQFNRYNIFFVDSVFHKNIDSLEENYLLYEVPAIHSYLTSASVDYSEILNYANNSDYIFLEFTVISSEYGAISYQSEKKLIVDSTIQFDRTPRFDKCKVNNRVPNSIYFEVIGDNIINKYIEIRKWDDKTDTLFWERVPTQNNMKTDEK